MKRLLFGAVLALTACAAPDNVADGEHTWVGTITTEGDVTTVGNESGSVWGGTARLVEEASIGVEAGADEYMFGRIEGLAASEDRIYVADGQVPALRAFDWGGSHLRDIGRRGQGPGEFQSVRSIGVDSAGRLWADDMEAGRLLVYSPDGEPIATIRKEPPIVTGSYPPIVVSLDGQCWAYYGFERTDSPNPRRLIIPYSLDGSTGEPVEIPEFDAPPPFMAVGNGRRFANPPFHPRGTFALSSAAAMISGLPDRYRFQIEHLYGFTTVVERRNALVDVDPAEAAAHQRAITSFLRLSDPQWRWPNRPIPPTKPAYTELIPATTGEIWVVRSGVGRPIPDCDEDDFPADGRVHCWVEERLVDIFDGDGRYLGDVPAPEGLVLATRPFIRGRDVVAVVQDEAGTIMVKRYRLVF